MRNLDKKLVIILPTYNESKSLTTLLNSIFREVSSAHIVIVDDSIVSENKNIKKIAAKFNNIVILTRGKKSGRGSAVLEGFKYALKNKELEFFVEMDTDLAHDPSELPLFYEALKKDTVHLVIGSRYSESSKIVDWPLRRLVMSKIINKCLNLFLGLNIRDYTNGYRMYKRNAVEYLVKTGLHETNFITLTESAFILKNKGFGIVEVPITFTDRKYGKSTVGVIELLSCLIGVFRIKLRHIFNQVK